MADQLASYKTVKHSKFLSLNEGMVWDGSSWKKKEEQETLPPDEVETIHDGCSDDIPLQDILNHLDDDQDIERMNNLYEEWGDMSISSDGGRWTAESCV